MHRKNFRANLGAAALLAASAGSVFAQASDDRLQKLEQRLDAMERQHRAELADRDRQIAELRASRGERPASRPSDDPAALLDEIDRADAPAARPSPSGSRDMLDLSRRHASDDAASRSRLGRGGVSFNPDIAVISDFLGSFSSNRGNEALNRLDIREVEVDLRAAVHPNADGVAILAFERDAENPVFPESGEEFEGLNSGVNVEEAYLFLHDFGVPNLTAKLGRFHVRFGRQNMLHLHDLPTSDPPLVTQAFLAPESLVESGISLSYVIPPRFVGGQYVEVIGEVLAGEGGGSESPTLRGDIDVDSPATNLHILWNRDLAPNLNLELGASWLRGHADSDNANDVNLYGADVTLLRRDPSGGFNNQLFQAEFIYGDTANEDGERQHAWGAYLLGQQQINGNWYAGLRLDYTQNPNADGEEAWAINPYVSFYWSEFLRFRVQYQHKDGDVTPEDNLYFQATWIFGAHPPHPYWSMR